jgi:hypothetical protein
MKVLESQKRVGRKTGRILFLGKSPTAGFQGRFLILGILSAKLWFGFLNQAVIFVLVLHFS